MNTTHITDTLADLFQAEDRRIVFWHDPEGEFEDFVRTLSLDGVQVVLADEVGSLELKVRLELEDPQGRYLLYFRSPEPEPDQDWLLDIRLYAKTFHADRASILLGELGLVNQSMRAHLQSRKSFFNSKDRLERARKLITPQDREAELDVKLLAVLTRAEHPGCFEILMRLFGLLCSDRGCDLKTVPSAWNDIIKHDLDGVFWTLMTDTFGYREEQPSLADLLIRLLVTDMANALAPSSDQSHGGLPGSLVHFLLPERAKATNASVFVAQWRSHMTYTAQFTLLSDAVGRELEIEKHLGGYGHEALVDVMTFAGCERLIIRSVRDAILRGSEHDHLDDPDALHRIILRRKDGHWAGVVLEEHGQGGNVYHAVYEALAASVDLLGLRAAHDAGFNAASAKELFTAYTRELFRFDQVYRLFLEAADRAELAGWDVLKEIRSMVEACYANWYLDRLALGWGAFLEGEDGLLQSWQLEDIPSQQLFFSRHVKSILNNPSKSKVFVIISDALRFEIAEELTRRINAQTRFKADLSAMLGVLPSYTGLGMAALLPHDRYGFKPGTDHIQVDGLPCAALEQRAAILANHGGMAVRADDLLAMSKDTGRDLVRPCRVIYIYHNQVDAVGDDAATETKTFAAARTAIEELAALVRFIINSLNGSNVLITADHGFLYQDTPPTPLEKSALANKPDGVLKAKKRYILGRDLGTTDAALRGVTSITAGTRPGQGEDGDMEFWIPRGVNRFHFSGGARFVHGGAMPQEIVIPVVEIKELEGKTRDRHAVRPVGISLLGSNRKIVNAIQRFEFIQTEKVSDRVQPRTVSIAIREGESLVSSEETVTFESASELMDDRKQSVRLMLKKGGYDKQKDYALVIRDAETKIEVERIPVTIDLAFENDF